MHAGQKDSACWLCRTAAPHDGVALGHLASAQGEAGGDDSREALRNGGHGERDSNLEVVDAVVQGELHGLGVGDPGGALESLPGQEVVVVNHPYQHTDGKDDLQFETAPTDQHPQGYSHFSKLRPACKRPVTIDAFARMHMALALDPLTFLNTAL